MNKFKFDKARKELRIPGLKKPIKAQTLDYFVGQENDFDRDLSYYIKYKGFVFIIKNPSLNKDEEIHNDINLQYQDAPEQARLFAMKSEVEIEEINNIKEEYGY